MKNILTALAALTLAACQAETQSDNPETLNGDAELKAEVGRIIKQNLERNHPFELTRLDGEILCGTMKRQGRSVAFYVDLVDEELFLDDGVGAAVVQAACGA